MGKSPYALHAGKRGSRSIALISGEIKNFPHPRSKEPRGLARRSPGYLRRRARVIDFRSRAAALTGV